MKKERKKVKLGFWIRICSSNQESDSLELEDILTQIKVRNDSNQGHLWLYDSYLEMLDSNHAIQIMTQIINAMSIF